MIFTKNIRGRTIFLFSNIKPRNIQQPPNPIDYPKKRKEIHSFAISRNVKVPAREFRQISGIYIVGLVNKPVDQVGRMRLMEG